jgi:hypothetical protein
MFYDAGYSIVMQGSHFHWEFVNSMPDGFAPGLPDTDSEYLRLVTIKILDDLKKKYNCEPDDKIIVGDSTSTPTFVKDGDSSLIIGNKITVTDFDFGDTNSNILVNDSSTKNMSLVIPVSAENDYFDATGTNYNDIIDVSNIGITQDGSGNVNSFDGNDSIIGSAGSDIINCGNGNNTISGGLGFDYITVGEGKSTYLYNAGDEFDTIILENNANITIRYWDASKDSAFVKDDFDIYEDSENPGNIVICRLGNDDRITVQGVTFSELKDRINFISAFGESASTEGSYSFDTEDEPPTPPPSGDTVNITLTPDMNFTADADKKYIVTASSNDVSATISGMKPEDKLVIDGNITYTRSNDGNLFINNIQVSDFAFDNSPRIFNPTPSCHASTITGTFAWFFT